MKPTSPRLVLALVLALAAGLLACQPAGPGADAPPAAPAEAPAPAPPPPPPLPPEPPAEAPPAAADADAGAAAEPAADAEAAAAPAFPAGWRREPVEGRVKAPRDVARPPRDALRTEAGVFLKVLQKGAGGPSPGPSSVVTVHYTGWTTDGRMFDTSLRTGEPSTFRLDGVIAGWTDGLQHLAAGDTARLWIPEALAYKGKPGRPKGMLVFDIELLGFE